MLKGAVLVLGSLTAALSLYLFAKEARAQPPIDPTHYWTYHLTVPYPQSVSFEARDQFNPVYRPMVTQRLLRLLNPAWKYHDGVPFPPRDSTAHLAWWDVDDVPNTRTVRVSNQFGERQTLQVYDLDFILLPARKTEEPNPPDPPRTINHYLCYIAVGAGPLVDVILRDQFHTQGQLVATATYFCNPCWKRHMGQEYPPNDDTHLVLYRLDTPGWQAPPRYLRDQFASLWNSALVQVPNEYIAVPSTKEEVPTPERNYSWGRVKSLFR